VARTGRRTEQASSDEGLSWRPKCQGKNVGCVEVIVSSVIINQQKNMFHEGVNVAWMHAMQCTDIEGDYFKCGLQTSPLLHCMLPHFKQRTQQ